MDSFKRLQSKVFTSVSSLRKTDESPDEQIYNTKRCFVHVNHLSIAIAVVELSILIYQLANGSWGNSEHATVFTIAALLFLLVIGLLFVAIFYRIGNLLIPHIVMQILLVLCFLGLTFATLYALFHGATFQLLVVITNPQIAADSMVRGHLDTQIDRKVEKLRIFTLAGKSLSLCLFNHCSRIWRLCMISTLVNNKVIRTFHINKSPFPSLLLICN
ncbi:hypothetical protein B9Z55_000434 [Caenorhabditis nigoni]|uniref:Uncharacterized protein n=1 Tax=Caenorhabditis nigoni TaxID=1611254 RepID=A0A2G5VT47_9PELO|nr:hypothetical protein B9Z55_000434 [Caenorhabditis nigoni]